MLKQWQCGILISFTTAEIVLDFLHYIHAGAKWHLASPHSSTGEIVLDFLHYIHTEAGAIWYFSFTT